MYTFSYMLFIREKISIINDLRGIWPHISRIENVKDVFYKGWIWQWTRFFLRAKVPDWQIIPMDLSAHAHRHRARRFNLSTSARNVARKGRITKFKDVDPVFRYFSSFVSIIINDIDIKMSRFLRRFPRNYKNWTSRY